MKKKKRKLKTLKIKDKFTFNKIKLNFSIKKLSKIPLTYIPNSLKSSVTKRLRKRKIKKKLLKYIFFKNFKFLNLKIKYNLNFKYKIIFLLHYFFIYKINILLKKIRLKYRLKKQNKWITLHNGKFYIQRKMPSLNITLSLLTETVTYGMRRQKKKKK